MRARTLVHGAAAVLALFATSACKPMDDAMLAVFGGLQTAAGNRNTGMRNSVAFDPYENTRPPAEGSMPFSAGNYTSSPTDRNVGHPIPVDYDLPAMGADLNDRAASPYNALKNPVPSDAASIARGKVMFERGCAICHGAAGDPTTSKLPVFGQMMGAFNLLTGLATGFTDGYIYGMIRQGRGVMPSYGHQIAHYDRWHIVNYIRSLQKAAAPPAATPGN